MPTEILSEHIVGKLYSKMNPSKPAVNNNYTSTVEPL